MQLGYEWTVPESAPTLRPDHACTILASRVKVVPGALELAFEPFIPVIWEDLMTSVGCLGGSLLLGSGYTEMWTMGAWVDSEYTDRFVQRGRHGVAMKILRPLVTASDFATWQMQYRQLPPEWLNFKGRVRMTSNYEYPEGAEVFGDRPGMSC